MSLQQKIDEIRQKPEHIRMRYVWGCVVVSMFLIVVLWVFSFTAGNVPTENPGLSSDQIMQEFQMQKQSMEDYKSQLNDMKSGFEEMQNQAESQSQTSESTMGQEQDPENISNEISPNSEQ